MGYPVNIGHRGSRFLGKRDKDGPEYDASGKKIKYLQYGGKWGDTQIEATPEQDNCTGLDLSRIPLDIVPQRSQRAGGSSNYRGVTLIRGARKEPDRWKAQIRDQGRQVNLGYYATEWEAGRQFARAYHKLYVMPSRPDPKAIAAAKALVKAQEKAAKKQQKMDAKIKAKIEARAAKKAARLGAKLSNRAEASSAASSSSDEDVVEKDTS